MDKSYSLEFQQSAAKLNELIQSCLGELHQAENVLKGKQKIAKIPTEAILEQLGDATGRCVKIHLVVEPLKTQAVQEVNESWQEWLETLENNLKSKWSSNQADETPVPEKQKELAQEYTIQFTQELKTELDIWIKQILKNRIELIDQNLESLYQNINLFSQNIETDFGKHIISDIERIKSELNKPIEHFSEYLEEEDKTSKFELLDFAVDLTSSIVGTVAGGLAGVFNFGGSNAAQPSIKQKVFEQGWEKFTQSKDKLLAKIREIVILIIDNRVETFTNTAEQVVSLYEELLEQQKRYMQETAEQQKAEKAWIAQKRHEIEQVQKNIEAILPS